MTNRVLYKIGGVYMAKVVGIGNESFQEIRENDCFYIDKTSFIKEDFIPEDK